MGSESSLIKNLAPIVFCVDENYLKYLAVLINQIEKLCDLKPDFYIITPVRTNISNYSNKLKKIAPGRVHFLEFDLNEFKGQFNQSSHITLATYLRLFIPHILPEEILFSLYLDVDILVIDNLDKLLTFKPDEVFSVVQASGTLTHHPMLVGIHPVFYGGVMLINHTKWREMKITERCLSIAGLHGPFENQDNDLLHLVVDTNESWGRIDPRYNVMFYEARALKRNGLEPAIIHFPGSDKPWNSLVGGRYAKVWRKQFSNLEPTFSLSYRAKIRYLTSKLRTFLQNSKICKILIKFKQRWIVALSQKS